MSFFSVYGIQSIINKCFFPVFENFHVFENCIILNSKRFFFLSIPPLCAHCKSIAFFSSVCFAIGSDRENKFFRYNCTKNTLSNNRMTSFFLCKICEIVKCLLFEFICKRNNHPFSNSSLSFLYRLRSGMVFGTNGIGQNVPKRWKKEENERKCRKNRFHQNRKNASCNLLGKI